MKWFKETLADVMNRKPRKPLRTLVELASEFGVHYNLLLRRIKTHSGPQAVMKTYTHGNHSWYEPVEMRKWWNKLPEDVK